MTEQGSHNSTNPSLEGKDIISGSKQYYRLSKAAETLGCSADDLLHMGATGNAEIIAPVISKGLFEWPIGSDGIAYNEIDDPFCREFGPADRVIISMSDLAEIEGVGWCVPSFFYDPGKARQMIEDARLFQYDAPAEELVLGNTSDESGEVVGSWTMLKLSPSELNDDLIALRELSFNTPWHAANHIGPEAERTTINHLFISKIEFVRLLRGQPQDSAALKRHEQEIENPRKEHGGTERFAKNREPVLNAAIYCLGKWQQQFKKKDGTINVTELTKRIEAEISLFCPKDSTKFLSTDSIEKKLSRVLQGKRPLED